MQESLRRLLQPPDFGNEDLNRRARLLNTILLILLVFNSLLIALYSMVPSPQFGHVLIYLALGVELLALLVLRIQRNITLAGRLLIYMLWILLMASTLTSDGVRGTPVLGQMILIFMSGLLIGEPLALTLGALTIVGNYIAMLLESNQGLLVPGAELSLSAHWAVQSGYLLLAIGFMMFFGRSMRANLDEVRRSEQTLKDRVNELRQAQAQLEMSDQNLRRREAILETLREAAEQLFREKSFDKAVQRVLLELGQATGVDRVYLFENHRDDRGRLLTSQRFEWAAEGVSPQINNPVLQNLDMVDEGLVRWPALLQKGIVIKGHVKDFPESEREHFTSQGILSLLVVPIFLGDELWGFIGFDETKWEREWSPAEEDALRGAGGILGGAIERRRAEQALNRSEARYLGILQDQFDLICRYTPDGKLIFANEAYTRFYGLDRAQLPDMTIWSQVLPERIEGLKAKIISLTQKEPVAISQSLNLRHDGEKRWIEWTERGIFDEKGTLLEVQAVGRDIDEEVRLRKQLEETLLQTETQAMSDGLTGLLNRRAITEHAEAEWHRAHREKRPLSLVLIDLDHLKEINDIHGHLIGDQALVVVGELLRSSMRRYDWAGRWGGDEFLLVLPGTNQREAVEVAERLRERVKQHGLKANQSGPIELHLSLGVASLDEVKPDVPLRNLLATADQALYIAKQSGRDRVATT